MISIARRTAIFSWTSALVGASATCLLVDAAISGRLTWSAIPALSCAFLWLAALPAIAIGRPAALRLLASTSVLLFPYLFLLELATSPGGWFFPLGLSIGALALGYAWLVYAIARLRRLRARAKVALALLASLLPQYAVNASLAAFAGEELVDAYDPPASALILLAAAVVGLWPRDRRGSDRG